MSKDVIYIGDRFAGKTHLAMELANPINKFVKVTYPDYQLLKSLFYDEILEGTQPTISQGQSVFDRQFDIEVTLPIGNRTLQVSWLDTPGEIWRKSWQEDNPDEWQECLEKIQGSGGIILVLSPYQEILRPDAQNFDKYVVKQQWVNRFERWMHFFQNDCPNARRIVICLNKADLIEKCDLARESATLAYDPYGSRMNWNQRNQHVLRNYMQLLQPSIEQINKAISGISVSCFITSVHDRMLLELPWIYLASFMSV
jgi:hypothetical protein